MGPPIPIRSLAPRTRRCEAAVILGARSDLRWDSLGSPNMSNLAILPEDALLGLISHDHEHPVVIRVRTTGYVSMAATRGFADGRRSDPPCALALT